MSQRMSTDKVYTLYQSPLLDAAAWLQGDRIRVKLKGPLSLLPSVRSSVEMFEGQIPAHAGEELCLSTWLPPLGSGAFSRLAKSQLKALLGMRTPDQVTISITEDCPNRCQHCALPDSGNHLRLQPEAVRDIIGQVLDLGATTVIFDGGEPALYRELPDLVRMVDRRAVSTLFTSGAGFGPALARDLKEAGLYAVNLSLDSPMPEEHDFMRGRAGVFREAMEAARYVRDAGLLLDLYVVLRRENICHLQGFHDLARNLGANELTFFEVVPTGRWMGKSDISLSAEDHAALQRFVASAKAPRIFSVPEALKRFGCFAGRSWMHITPAGDVYPCACVPQPVGNVFAESIAKIWHKMGSLSYLGSRTCPMRKA